MPARRLLIASNNLDKVDELRLLLGDCGWEIVAPSELGLRVDAEETGATYAENARIKAEAFMRASGLPSLADDSGLEVDALNGEPGALHHLNGWDGRDQAERIQHPARCDERRARGRADGTVSGRDRCGDAGRYGAAGRRRARRRDYGRGGRVTRGLGTTR